MTLSRRDFVKLCGHGALAPVVQRMTKGRLPRQEDRGAASAAALPVPAARTATRRDRASATSGASRPNILCFHVDNLGMGELGCYGGGALRGADTRRIDQFSAQGLQLLNFAPEAQCTPSRSALMTGRYSIRSGCHTIRFADQEGGLVAWERTIGDVSSAQGYACA